MKKYLENLIEEKGLDLDQPFEVDGAISLTLEVVIEAILNSTKAEQEKIRKTLIQIDFTGGNVMHYFNFLAHSIHSVFTKNNPAFS